MEQTQEQAVAGMMLQQENVTSQVEPGQKETADKVEDRVLKVAADAFGAEVHDYLGIEGKIKRKAPTEQIRLKMRQLQEDFNFEMEGGYWRHYEFESDRVSVADMRRFREYESYLSMSYQVPVITTVLCSARVKKLRSKLKEGINTYHVEAIQLKKRNADKVLRRLLKKLKAGEEIKKADLIPLLLTPLMSGKTTICERILQGFRILKSVQDRLDKEEVEKMQAILYAFAVKFLKRNELEEVRKETGMTILGQMLMEDGRKEGRQEGRQEGERLLAQLMCSLFSDGRTEDARLAANDAKARSKLYEEYGLVMSK